MVLFKFTKAILNGDPIDVYNYGKMTRDFTYIDDVVEGILRISDKIPQPNRSWSGETPDPATSPAPYRLYNIGNHQKVDLLHFIAVLEETLGKRAKMRLQPMQPGDVPATYADVDDLIEDIGFKPVTAIEVGVKRFVEWYLDYYRA